MELLDTSCPGGHVYLYMTYGLHKTEYVLTGLSCSFGLDPAATI